MKTISEKSGVHIIASTGFYAEDTWPENFTAFSIDQYASIMLDEIIHGIDGTEIFPGHIKVAIEKDGVSPQEEKVLRAAVRVSRESGLSMTIHPGLMLSLEGSERVFDILKDENARADRIILCHQQIYFFPHALKTLITDPGSWRLNLDHAKKILDSGMNVCIDCFGHRWDLELLGVVMPEDYHRLAGLIALIEAGYSDQLVIGTDSFVKIHTSRFGGEGYRRLTDFVLPALGVMGVGKKDIERITIHNPDRILSVSK
jgi:phosphotriesterase-related protein